MNDTPRKIGKGMIYATWLLVLIGLTLLFNSMLEKRRNPNRTPQTQTSADGAREVILHMNRSGHYIARGQINKQPADFMLDTGATWVAIPSALADDLGLTRGAAMLVSTANGTATAYATTLDSVSIGNITLHDVRASITPSMNGREALLGMSFLRQLEFTQRGDVLILRQ